MLFSYTASRPQPPLPHNLLPTCPLPQINAPLFLLETSRPLGGSNQMQRE